MYFGSAYDYCIDLLEILHFVCYQSATRILRTLQLVDNIGTVLLNTKIASERPTNLRLDSFNITLEKLRSSEMSHKSVRNALTRIILPSAAVLLDETDGENLDVGVQVGAVIKSCGSHIPMKDKATQQTD